MPPEASAPTPPEGTPAPGDPRASDDPARDEAAREDEALIRRAQGGDLAAFNTLVLRHQDAVYGLALRFLSSREAAEDAAQEAFLRAYRSLDSFRGGKARSWLLTIVANLARDELRRRKRRPQRSLEAERERFPDRTPFEPADEEPTPEDQAVAGLGRLELRAELEAALATLPDEWRMTVLLADVHGLPHEEVAAATGVALGTVKSRISRARGRLRDALLAGREPGAAARRLEEWR
jgi:RNA polymerase sigma-70 factor, ECF subfamily